jgi:hypothetical protein
MIIDGKELEITVASLEDVFDLKDAIEESVKKGNLKISLDDIDFENIGKTNISDNTIGSFLNSVLSIDSSKAVRNCLFKCAERALFNKEKVDRALFEKEENRPYYYEIMIQIIIKNLSPFFKGLFSRLNIQALNSVVAAFQKSK